MELNLEEIEQRHKRTKLIRAAFGGMSRGIDDVDWLIAEVKRLREENDRLQYNFRVQKSERREND